MIKAILVVGENGEIGQNGDMPWGRRLPKDLEYFKGVTEGKNAVMGYNTYKSLPFKLGFPKRKNYVLTSRFSGFINHKSDRESFIDFDASLSSSLLKKDDTYLVGGATIYEQFWDYVSEAHITRVKSSFPEADTFFTPDLSDFEKVGEDIDVSGDDLQAYVEVWKRKK